MMMRDVMTFPGMEMNMVRAWKKMMTSHPKPYCTTGQNTEEGVSGGGDWNVVSCCDDDSDVKFKDEKLEDKSAVVDKLIWLIGKIFWI